MKFIEQKIELIERKDNVLKFKVNTSYATYLILKSFSFFDIELKKEDYITYPKKYNIKNFDLTTVEGAVEAYKYGIKFADIFRNSSIKRDQIVKELKRNNIPLRHHDTPSIDIDFEYFDNIDTPEKAYLLGMLQTDGCLREHKVEIIQKKEYCWYIIDLYKNINLDFSVLNHTSCYRIRLIDKRLENKLNNMGIVRNKTYEQTDEDIDKLFSFIPDEYLFDFIRGLIDGDGSVSFYMQQRGINESGEIMFCARSKHIVEKVADIIHNKIGYCPKFYINHGVNGLRIRDTKIVLLLGNILFRNFKYPFGHPKKAIPYLKRINIKPEFAEYGDPNFKITYPYYLDLNDIDSIYEFYENVSREEYEYRNEVLKCGIDPESNIKPHMNVEITIECNVDVFKRNDLRLIDGQVKDVYESMKKYFSLLK